MSARKREQTIHEDELGLFVVSHNLMIIRFDPWKREAAAEFTWTACQVGPTNWYAQSTYAAERGERSGPKCYMHIVLNAPLPDGLEWDHINHDGLDNRDCNLRAVTHRMNMANRRDRKERA